MNLNDCLVLNQSTDMRNLTKMTETGLSLEGKANHRESISAKFEILQNEEHCNYTYLLVSHWFS